MTKLDARGLSCPEPVILLRKALQNGDNCYVMQVDNHASRENAVRCAEHQGYQVKIQEEAGSYILTMTK